MWNTATTSQALFHSQAEADSTAEDGSHVQIGAIVVNAEEELAGTMNEGDNAAETTDTTRIRSSARERTQMREL